MAASAVVAGRAGYSALGLAVMIGVGLAVGWRWHMGFGPALIALGLLLLLRVVILWIGIFAGLVAGSPTAVVAVQVLVRPIGFLSSAFTAPSTMPGWLGAVVEWNPLSATPAADRELFGNPGWVAPPGPPNTRCPWPSPGLPF